MNGRGDLALSWSQTPGCSQEAVAQPSQSPEGKSADMRDVADIGQLSFKRHKRHQNLLKNPERDAKPKRGLKGPRTSRKGRVSIK